MFTLATWALAAVSAAPVPDCSWDRPGHDRYTGTTQAAVDRYTDIPAAVRTVLKQRLQQHRYDDVAAIRRDSIEGRQRYGSELRDMHFGSGRVCASVSRSGWSQNQVERGLVYCEGEHCLIVPTVCGNVSRISRGGAPAAAGRGAAAPMAAEGGAAVAAAQPLDAAGGDGGGAPAALGAEPGSGSTPTSDGVSFADASAASGAAPPVGFVEARPGVGGGFAPGGVPGTFSSPLDVATTIENGPVAAVPEPQAWALWLVGAALLSWRVRRLRGRR